MWRAFGSGSGHADAHHGGRDVEAGGAGGWPSAAAAAGAAAAARAAAATTAAQQQQRQRQQHAGHGGGAREGASAVQARGGDAPPVQPLPPGGRGGPAYTVVPRAPQPGSRPPFERVLLGAAVLLWLLWLLPHAFVLCFFVGVALATCMRVSAQVQTWRYQRGLAQRVRSSLERPGAGGEPGRYLASTLPNGTHPQQPYASASHTLVATATGAHHTHHTHTHVHHHAGPGGRVGAGAPQLPLQPQPTFPPDGSWVIFHGRHMPAELDIANLQLSLMASSLAPARAEPQVQPLSAADIASLTTYAWHRPGASSSSSSATRRRQPHATEQQQEQQEQQGSRGDDADLGGRRGSGEGGGSPERPSCAVCLDTFADGDHMMLLRCMHQFHADCITPWLQRQGRQAQCPVCKTPCFLA